MILIINREYLKLLNGLESTLLANVARLDKNLHRIDLYRSINPYQQASIAKPLRSILSRKFIYPLFPTRPFYLSPRWSITLPACSMYGIFPSLLSSDLPFLFTIVFSFLDFVGYTHLLQTYVCRISFARSVGLTQTCAVVAGSRTEHSFLFANSQDQHLLSSRSTSKLYQAASNELV